LRVSSFYQKSVHIGLAKFESESRVQSIGRLARGPRREVDRSNVAPARLFDRRVRQGFADSHSSSGTVHDDVFDPRRSPVGIGKTTSVNDPTIRSSSRAMKTIVAGDATVPQHPPN